MTIEELAKLSDEELRVRCGTLLGYRRDPNSGMWENDNRALPRVNFHLPNYPADLNAMHEAEKTLSEDGLYAYDDFIWELNLKSNRKNGKAEDWLWHATARQRCIAFIAVKQQPVEVKGGGE